MQASSDVEIAARLIALNKTCFNGLYRVNRKGEFSVPPGKYKNPLICDSSNLENVSNTLSRATIFAGDYRNVTRNAQKGDFIYLDPPYQPLNNTYYFTGHTMDGFDDRDQSQLAEVFRKLNSRGCPFIYRMIYQIPDYNRSTILGNLNYLSGITIIAVQENTQHLRALAVQEN